MTTYAGFVNDLKLTPHKQTALKDFFAQLGVPLERLCNRGTLKDMLDRLPEGGKFPKDFEPGDQAKVLGALKQASIFPAAASTASFWRHLSAAQLKTEVVALKSGPDDDAVRQEVTLLNLTQGTKFLGDPHGLSSILIPQSYRDLWNEAEPLLQRRLNNNATGKRGKPVNCYYTGTSGIGIAVAGWYFMYELRRQYGDKINIVYQHERGKQQYLFAGNGEAWVSATGHGSFTDVLQEPTTVYMVHGKGVRHLPHVCKLVFTSYDDKDLSKWYKLASSSVRFLPVWTLPQLMAARQLLYPHVREERVKELYSKWGGVPRVVLQNANNGSYLSTQLDAVFARRKCDLQDILTRVGEVPAEDELSQIILHHVAESGYLYEHKAFASQWVANDFVRRAGHEAEHIVAKFLAGEGRNLRAADLHDQVLKALAHMMLHRKPGLHDQAP